MEQYPKVIIAKQMIEEAENMINLVKVNRTKASPIDTLIGILGEYIFAQHFYGDWRQNNIGRNKGMADFENIEIKASATPFRNGLHLLVREDYAHNRKTAFYVQVIIDLKNSTKILPNTIAYLCGFATVDEVEKAPKKDFGSKYGGPSGYLCHYISIKKLHPMVDLRNSIAKMST